MDNLVQQMKVVIATTFAFYLKAQNFHWNVEGSDFPQYHGLFGDVYNETWEAVDVLAEHLRTLDSFVPGSLTRFQSLSVIEDQLNIPEPRKMIIELERDNKILIGEINKAYDMAEESKKLGLSNYLQDRLTAHEKHGWMLRATSK
jgi:starvation-inducible DNA-binding protein